MIRICPSRDARCPHGVGCPHADGYACNEGPTAPDHIFERGPTRRDESSREPRYWFEPLLDADLDDPHAEVPGNAGPRSTPAGWRDSILDPIPTPPPGRTLREDRPAGTILVVIGHEAVAQHRRGDLARRQPAADHGVPAVTLLFRVFASWTRHDGEPDTANIERTASTPAAAAESVRSALAPLAREGVVLIRKIKRVKGLST